MTAHARVGIDENGLGARLGVLVVTGVLADVSDDALRFFRRALPRRLRADLDDSKALVAHGDASLGEAWARALVPEARAPDELLASLALEGVAGWQALCPAEARAQCWDASNEAFQADGSVVTRVRGHLAWLAERGLVVRTARTSLVCTRALNDARRSGRSRFEQDLHAMERLCLGLRDVAGTPIHAVCGKVGGMADYARFFGPLAGHLHVELQRSRAASGYRFPRLGEIHFVKDADARDPLVMLASLIGKWLRELCMARVTRFHSTGATEPLSASGYHDPVTAGFVAATSLARRSRAFPDACFERERDLE